MNQNNQRSGGTGMDCQAFGPAPAAATTSHPLDLDLELISPEDVRRMLGAKVTLYAVRKLMLSGRIASDNLGTAQHKILRTTRAKVRAYVESIGSAKTVAVSGRQPKEEIARALSNLPFRQWEKQRNRAH